MEPLLNRPGVMGLNSNVTARGISYHIQTEDLGPRTPQVVTHVFVEGGHVIKVVRIDYAHHLDKPNLRVLLPKVMKAHHASIVARVLRGDLSDDSPGSSEWTSPGAEVTQPLAIRGTAAAQAGDRETPKPGQAPEQPPRGANAKLRGRSGEFKAAPRVAVTTSPSLSLAVSKAISPATKSAREIWDRLVEEAQRDRSTQDVTNVGDIGAGNAVDHGSPVQEVTPELRRAAKGETEHAPTTARAWDLAVQSRRLAGEKPDSGNCTVGATLDPAVIAFNAGVDQMRKPDKTDAVVSFARAVELDPHNPRYRANLRRALDWLDSQEREDRR